MKATPGDRRRVCYWNKSQEDKGCGKDWSDTGRHSKDVHGVNASHASMEEGVVEIVKRKV